jgi:hypothetical protein
MMTLHLPRSTLMAYQKHRCQVPSSYWWLLLSCNAHASYPWELHLHPKLAKQALYIRPLYSSHYHIRTLCSNWPTTKMQDVQPYRIVIRC